MYQDTPLNDAVADLSKSIGHLIFLSDQDGKLRNRMLTLTTGEVSFWEAFDQFCAKAGVVEGVPQVSLSPARPQLPQPGQPGLLFRVQRGVITLQPGQPQPSPTDYSTAVRVKVVGHPHLVQGVPDMTELRLKLNPEPRLRWQELLEVRVEKAVDEHGQNLLSAKKANQPPPLHAVPQGGLGRFGGNNPALDNDNVVQIAVPLRRGEKDSSSIVEIKGVIAAKVSIPGQELLVVDDVMTVQGKKVKGTMECAATVVSVTPDGQGYLDLRLELDLPAHLAGAERATLISTPLPGLNVFDARGDRIVVAITTQGSRPNEYLVKLRPAGDQKPAKLSFRAPEGVNLNIPFTLKNVAVKKAGTVFTPPR